MLAVVAAHPVAAVQLVEEEVALLVVGAPLAEAAGAVAMLQRRSGSELPLGC